MLHCRAPVRLQLLNIVAGFYDILTPVSRFRSSHALSARSHANFGIEGTLQNI
jgi:hypothetical protein